METRQRTVIGDAREPSQFDADSVELVVTSPPYPMIEMWDELFEESLGEIERLAAETVSQRLERHEAFVEERLEAGEEFKYESDVYGVPVRTKQETKLQLYTIEGVDAHEREYVVSHTPSGEP